MLDEYKKSVGSLVKEFSTNIDKGLSVKEAEARLEKYGYNRIESKKKISPLKIFIEQFKNPVIYVLLGALVISSIVSYIEYHEGEITFLEVVTEPSVIAAIVIINAVIGFFQEYRAEKAIESLKKMASLKAVVVRDGKEIQLDAEFIVPGDIILLFPGEKIPADARLISVKGLQTQEAALTGESLPVKKEVVAYEKDLQLGDRKNMVFSGTVITEGKGKALVVRTGMQTEIGKIATMIESTEETVTPLQEKLQKLGKYITYLTISICFIVFTVLFFREPSLKTALLTSVSLAVAAIPEGLPAVVTISLALGVRRMIRKNALIRKLPSVETLGSTTVICTDKTGTLTKNEMTVRKVYVDGKIIDVSGLGYEPRGNFSEKPKDLDLLLKIGLLNNDAKLENKEGTYSIMGDPTEGALIVSAAKMKIDYEKVVKEFPRIDEVLFDSKRKRMTTVHKIDGKKFAYVKGAPDVILGLCTKIMIDGKVREIKPDDRKLILEMNRKFSADALRVLGFAYRELAEKDKDYEKNLVFVGLQGMIDPPRDEVKEAIMKCKTAGIKVVMITGDHVGTAMAIAKELGIEGKAVTGQELEKINLDKEVEEIGIYARVDPEHKMRIVNALKKKGHVVAMTGDGVNDAPALKSADIGISMGITGTDVSKEASDMILTDDNFASIVNAVEEGRGIFDNIKKFVQYLLSSNLGEILVIFAASIIFDALPLLPVQILWMNLVTDGLPAIALGVDPGAKDIMKRKPRNPKEGIITTGFGFRVFYTGVLIALGTLFVFWYSRKYSGVDLIEAQTLAFTTLVLLQFVRLQIIRQEYKLGIFSNKSLIVAVLASLLLQMAVIYLPFFRSLFKTTLLTAVDWVLLGIVAVLLLAFSMVVNKILRIIKGGD